MLSCPEYAFHPFPSSLCEQVLEELQAVSEDDLIDGKMLLIAAGKKNKMLVKLGQ